LIAPVAAAVPDAAAGTTYRHAVMSGLAGMGETPWNAKASTDAGPVRIDLRI
jgi:hypothetical protein